PAPERQLVGEPDPQQTVIARPREAEPRRRLQHRAIAELPSEDGREIVPLLARFEALRGSQAAVHLRAQDEILSAGAAGSPASQASKRAPHAHADPQLTTF